MLHIIVPTTGPQPRLRNMLASLALHTDPCHLVLVVNPPKGEDWQHAAVGPQIQCLRDNGWRVSLQDEGEMIGYTPACNQAWRSLIALPDDYVAVLNDDVVIEGRWAEPLMEALDAGAELVGPSLKTVGADGFWGRPDDPPYIEGWCLMVRFPGAHSLWLFDPQFAPQLCEDMDFGLTFQKDPPGTILQVDVPIRHARHATVDPSTQPEVAAAWADNRLKLIAKWKLGGSPPSSPGFQSTIPGPPPPAQAHPLGSQAAQQGWTLIP